MEEDDLSDWWANGLPGFGINIEAVSQLDGGFFNWHFVSVLPRIAEKSNMVVIDAGVDTF